MEIEILEKRVEALYTIFQQPEINQTQLLQHVQDIASHLLYVINITQPVLPKNILFISSLLDNLIS